MKLRIKGDSLRFRVAPSDVSRLMETGQVEDTIHFGPSDDARLTYALELADQGEIAVRYETARVTVVLPAAMARIWAEGTDVGVYGSVPVATGRLEIAVEKDWACLDKSEVENADTFPNPRQGANC